MKSPQKPLISVTIYQQECHGVEQWRVSRDDGKLFMLAHQVDFATAESAVSCTWSELRRSYGDCRWQVRISRNYTAANGHSYTTLKSPQEVEA